MPFTIALSGYGDALIRTRAADAGFDRYLAKPADSDALIRLQLNRNAVHGRWRWKGNHKAATQITVCAESQHGASEVVHKRVVAACTRSVVVVRCVSKSPLLLEYACTSPDPSRLRRSQRNSSVVHTL